MEMCGYRKKKMNKKIDIYLGIISNSLAIVISTIVGYEILKYLFKIFNININFIFPVLIILLILSLYTTYKLYNVKNIENKILIFLQKISYPVISVLAILIFIIMVSK